MNKGDSGKHKTYSKLSVLIVGKSEPQPKVKLNTGVMRPHYVVDNNLIETEASLSPT